MLQRYKVCFCISNKKKKSQNLQEKKVLTGAPGGPVGPRGPIKPFTKEYK